MVDVPTKMDATMKAECRTQTEGNAPEIAQEFSLV